MMGAVSRWSIYRRQYPAAEAEEPGGASLHQFGIITPPLTVTDGWHGTPFN